MAYFVGGLGSIVIIFTALIIAFVFLRDAKIIQVSQANACIKFAATAVLVWLGILFIRFWFVNASREAVSFLDFESIYAPRSVVLGILIDASIALALTITVPMIKFEKIPTLKSWIIFVGALASRPILLLIQIYRSGHGSMESVLAQLAQAGDAVHYIRIAEIFYPAYGQPYANQIVFYPLFPILMRVVSFIPFVSFAHAGILISWVSFGFAAVALYRICKESLFPVLLLCFAPFGIFFSVIMTESLFIALTLFSMHKAMKREWFWAGWLGFLSALTRSQGVVVVGFFLYEYGLHCMEESENPGGADASVAHALPDDFSPSFVASSSYIHTLSESSEKSGSKTRTPQPHQHPLIAGLKKVRSDVLYALLIPFGMFLYLLLNRLIQGEWFRFLQHHAAEPWFNTANWIGDNLTQQWNMGTGFGLGAIIYFVQIAAFFLVFALLIYSIVKKQRNSFIIYGFGYMFTSFTHGWLISGPRYVTTCVVLYILADQAKNNVLRAGLLLASLVMAILLGGMFLDGHAIM